MNELFENVEAGAERSVLENYFQELEDYTHYHFKREEALMIESCPSAEYEKQIRRHQKQHQYFIRKIPELKEKLLTSGSKEVSFEILDFLLHWLIDHIINEDLSLTQCFITPAAGENRKNRRFFQRLAERINARFPLSRRVFFLIFIPMLLVGILTAYLSWQTYRQYTYLSEVGKVSDTFVGLNRLINTLQRERGLSSGYLASDGQRFAKELQQQRVKTDTIINRCVQRLKCISEQADASSLVRRLEALAEIRDEIDAKEITVETNIDYYSLLIESIIEIIKKTGNRYFLEGNDDSHASLLMLMYLKENDGLLRSEGASILSSSSRDISRFKRLLILKEAYFKSFQLLATQKLLAGVLAIEHSENSETIKRMEKVILAPRARIDFSADQWFAKMSTHIDAYEKVIEGILKNLQKEASRLKEKEIVDMAAVWLFLLFFILLTAVISYALKESILQPVVSLTEALQRLSKGDKVFKPNHYPQNDAIGKMIDAYNDLRKSLIRADFAAMLLEMQERKTQKYEELAYLDPLTGILNRRKYNEILRREFLNARHAEPVCVLILDLDHFKTVNDRYGHDIGDKVLIAFSETIAKAIRADDVFARIGGEEFALVFIGTAKETAMKIAEKLLRTVENMDLSHVHEGLNLTVSIGLACSCERYDTVEAMIKSADYRLYEAKRNGRNRVKG